MVGKNIGYWLQGQGGELPRTISKYGTKKEEIFVSYETVKGMYNSRTDSIPLGALAIYTFVDKLRVGLQQLMAGSRNFRLSAIERTDLISLTEECAKVSGIPYVMDAYREEAERIING